MKTLLVGCALSLASLTACKQQPESCEFIVAETRDDLPECLSVEAISACSAYVDSEDATLKCIGGEWEEQ